MPEFAPVTTATLPVRSTGLTLILGKKLPMMMVRHEMNESYKRCNEANIFFGSEEFFGGRIVMARKSRSESQSDFLAKCNVFTPVS